MCSLSIKKSYLHPRAQTDVQTDVSFFQVNGFYISSYSDLHVGGVTPPAPFQPRPRKVLCPLLHLVHVVPLVSQEKKIARSGAKCAAPQHLPGK